MACAGCPGDLGERRLTVQGRSSKLEGQVQVFEQPVGIENQIPVVDPKGTLGRPA
jgi:hypothetical protein